jgi:hypothetical protein
MSIKKILSSLSLGQGISIKAAMLPELQLGDIIFAGKFKNKKAEITGFTKDDWGQPVVETDKGNFQVFKFRLEKLFPKEKRK